MATSGSVGITSYKVVQLIEHAARRCGKIASTLTSEMLEISLDCLNLVMQNTANDGINLWCIEKVLIAESTDAVQYTLPVATVDVLKVMHRTAQTVDATWTSPSALILQAELNESATVVTVAIVASSDATVNLVFETSQDGVTWALQSSQDATVVTEGSRYYFDIDTTTSAQYFRIRETVAVSLAVDSAELITQNTEIPVARVNRDDYMVLPDKRSQGTPTQFWYDRQLTPVIVLWPRPAQLQCLAVWRYREVMDVGSLSNTLEIPSRWVDGIIWKLAAALCFELPDVEEARKQGIVTMAEKHYDNALREEFDRSPMYLRPNISPYNA